MTFSIRFTTVDEMLGETATRLQLQHREELTTNKALMKLAPDEAKYKVIEAAGKLLALVAELDGVIIGYSINFIDCHPHYKDLIISNNDLLYLDKAHRRSNYGKILRDETKKRAKDKGAKMQMWHAKPGSAFKIILERDGCKVQDVIYSEEL